MADPPSNTLKRLHPGDGLGLPHKRPRSNNESPAPTTNGSAPAGQKPDVNKIVADAVARAAEAAARLQGTRGVVSQPPQSLPSGNGHAPSTGVSAGGSTALSDRLAQLRARMNAIKAPSAGLQRTASPLPTYQAPEFEDGSLRARGGLDVGLHPALLGDSGPDGKSSKSRQAMQPKFATTMANRRTESPAPVAKNIKQLDLSGPSAEETRKNPYFDPSLGPQTATGRNRITRQLVFNQKGKYIQQANALRRQAALEDMRRRIAESARKAGIDEDLETEKSFLVPTPPDIEWWDEGLVNGKDYNSIEDPASLKIDTDDTIITIYIQHPILLEPPQDKNIPPPKPMYLTKKEQAKLRRQNHAADRKEKQAKIRLGLEPAPPPKVKKSNLMRVLGEEAVKDPTAVEARVNREIAERHQKHLEANEERKLTKEQRHEKIAANQEKDTAKGIYCLVYKVDNLSNGRHRFKISKNAEQNALTGVCILHPKFNLIVVEGGQHSIAFYKKLMLNRIDWTENSPSIVREGNQDALASWLQAEDEKGELKDLTLNKCVLISEVELKNRGFRKWSARVCETDAAARDVLSRAKMEHFWTLAKSMK